MKYPCCSTFFWLFSALLLSVPGSCVATDSLSLTQSMRAGDTLISSGGMFELGFFSKGNSGKQYLGIWYHNIQTQTIVWVANRNNPLNDSSGILMMQEDGNLVILDGTERMIWSSNTSNLSLNSNMLGAKLLDSGNLVLLQDESSNDKTEAYLWQSFNHPTDTILAGMKIGWDLRTNLDLHLTSWKSADDPSPGDFTWAVDIRGFPQIFLYEGNTKRYRTGPFKGLDQVSSATNITSSAKIFVPKFISTPSEVYYLYDQHNESTVSIGLLKYSGTYQRSVWDSQKLQWVALHMIPTELCDEYGSCGPNSLCTSTDVLICRCLTGYEPTSPREWNMSVWSSGCIRMKPLNCSAPEGFKTLRGVKWPDFIEFKVSSNISIDECKAECLRNCSCTAYANMNVNGREGSSCFHWFGDLVDIQRTSSGNSPDLSIRVMASEQDPISDRKQMKLALSLGLSLSVLSAMLICSWVMWKKRRKAQVVKFGSQVKCEESLELPVFDVITISKATDNFSYSNKIGEGGFGPVYKGRLPNGQAIAVKRLSENSRQGLDEFKNEVMFIAKLQHRNLVRLLGCCTEGEERMLIYEYMPNGSLDSFIFGKSTSNTLEWRSRFNIIVGVARGLLYLHRDSRLRIIHRDLKASNVLLDQEMNPKVSDFGLARIYGGDLSLTKTKRIIGTYGYMSPEYAIDGLISVKSDVFSFGVLVLEIVSGRRNREFQHHDHAFNLLGHAWKLWGDDQALELVDEQMQDSFPESEVLRCIQIGLLCVQKHPKDRPTMPSVLTMLDSENSILPQPKQPGFYSERSLDQRDDESTGENHSTNQITITLVQGR